MLGKKNNKQAIGNCRNFFILKLLSIINNCEQLCSTTLLKINTGMG